MNPQDWSYLLWPLAQWPDYSCTLKESYSDLANRGMAYIVCDRFPPPPRLSLLKEALLPATKDEISGSYFWLSALQAPKRNEQSYVFPSKGQGEGMIAVPTFLQ